MDSITVGLGALISLSSGLIGAAAFWFKIKNSVEILNVKLCNIEKENSEIKRDSEKDAVVIHQRIANVKQEVEKNREKSDASLEEIKKDMAEMKIEIIKAIGDLKR
tara:strand:+ start:353 stop:670 length:318 start_codon:yes stop_codon:yes gene_type:complete